MDIITLLTLIGATWRLSSFLVNEDGPFDVFAWLRTWVGVHYNEYGVMDGGGFFAGVFDCVWCMSAWVGAAVTVAYCLYPVATSWFCLPLALSAGAVVLEKINGKS